MSIKLWRIAGPALGVTLMTGICAAQEPPKVEKPLSQRVSGAAENLKAGAFRAEGQVGEKVGGAVDSIKKGAKNAGNALREQYEKARTSVHNMGVTARVYGRLHWDKQLTSSTLDIDVKEGRRRLDYCVQGLWYLGRKSDMAFLAATILSHASEDKEKKLNSYLTQNFPTAEPLDTAANDFASQSYAYTDFSNQFPFTFPDMPPEMFSNGMGFDEFVGGGVPVNCMI